MQRLSYFRNR